MEYIGMIYWITIVVYIVVLLTVLIRQLLKGEFFTALLISMVGAGSGVMIIESKFYELMIIQLMDIFIK